MALIMSVDWRYRQEEHEYELMLSFMMARRWTDSFNECATNGKKLPDSNILREAILCRLICND